MLTFNDTSGLKLNGGPSVCAARHGDKPFGGSPRQAEKEPPIGHYFSSGIKVSWLWRVSITMWKNTIRGLGR